MIETFHFAITDTIKLLQSVADKKADQPRIQTIIEFYLSSVHRDQKSAVYCLHWQGRLLHYRKRYGKLIPMNCQ
ncbi:hypothetical protein [Bacillus altitudinis]|uniref:hypothetical protein n=1 Tax=Bacillus altitudinis TaxID=293387 RepID=UPI003B519EB8